MIHEDNNSERDSDAGDLEQTEQKFDEERDRVTYTDTDEEDTARETGTRVIS